MACFLFLLDGTDPVHNLDPEYSLEQSLSSIPPMRSLTVERRSVRNYYSYFRFNKIGTFWRLKKPIKSDENIELYICLTPDSGSLGCTRLQFGGKLPQ